MREWAKEKREKKRRLGVEKESEALIKPKLAEEEEEEEENRVLSMKREKKKKMMMMTTTKKNFSVLRKT